VHALFDEIHQRVFHRAADLGIALVIHARHLLIARRHDAHLCGRSTLEIGDESARRNLRDAQQVPQLLRRIVFAHDTDQFDTRAETFGIERHIGGAAGPVLFMRVGHDRNGRLGRDARHVTEDELIQHYVADDDEPA
jgi:hypothetical protein